MQGNGRRPEAIADDGPVPRIGVNRYISVPAADPGRSIVTAISDGPGGLTVRIVLGLLLIPTAVGLLAGHWGPAT
jgi:hypothetical protein